jgi:hypothetical protein
MSYDYNRSYLADTIAKKAQDLMQLHYKPKKDSNNKVSNLRSQSVAKQIQKRELERYEESLLQKNRIPATTKNQS